MTPSTVPEPVYDAAIRVITRDERPDDAERLRMWWKGDESPTVREMALEAIRHVAECGYYRAY